MPPSETDDPFGIRQKITRGLSTVGLALVDLGTCDTTGLAMVYLSNTGSRLVVIDDTWSNTTNSDYNRNYGPDPICDWSWMELRPTKPNKIWYLLHAYGKLLTEAEKAIIRELNFEPTKKGIRLCQEVHRKVMSWIRSIPQMMVRFDRRVPCWRAGRWKSLT